MAKMMNFHCGTKLQSALRLFNELWKMFYGALNMMSNSAGVQERVCSHGSGFLLLIVFN